MKRKSKEAAEELEKAKDIVQLDGPSEEPVRKKSRSGATSGKDSSSSAKDSTKRSKSTERAKNLRPNDAAKNKSGKSDSRTKKTPEVTKMKGSKNDKQSTSDQKLEKRRQQQPDNRNKTVKAANTEQKADGNTGACVRFGGFCVQKSACLWREVTTFLKLLPGFFLIESQRLFVCDSVGRPLRNRYLNSGEAQFHLC